MKQFVLIEQDDDTIFCLGVYTDSEKAVGAMMNEIWEFGESYEGEGDEFSYSSAPYELEGDSGIGMTVRYKHSTWNESLKREYYVLISENSVNERP